MFFGSSLLVGTDVCSSLLLSCDFTHNFVNTPRWSYGTIGSEVWIFNGVHLVRPDNAIAASSPASHQAPDDLRSSYMSRLADEEHDDYIVPDPLPPGVGFPGILFQEAASGSITQTDINIGALDIDLDKNRTDPETQENPKRRDRKKTRQDSLVWRKVQSIVQNPDNQITERMDAIASAGVGDWYTFHHWWQQWYCHVLGKRRCGCPSIANNRE